MKASEAVQLTDNALSGPIIQKAERQVDGLISAAAARGETSINFTHALNLCDPKLTPNQRKAVHCFYEQNGFTITHYSGDQRDLRDHAYDTLSWG